MSEPVLACQAVGKTYRDGQKIVDVLSALTFTLDPGESVAIVGRSGSGKSTLLNVLGGLDTPTCGSVYLLGRDITLMNEGERCRWRNQQLGFVFQFHHLLAEFSAVEAVAMPARMGGLGREAALRKAASLLTQVGLADRLDHRPHALSGGERQRVAIARALINNPGCVLMDEPTGNLDSKSSAEIMALFEAIHADGNTVVMVTHEEEIAKHAKRTIRMIDGKLASQLSVTNP